MTTTNDGMLVEVADVDKTFRRGTETIHVDRKSVV